MSKKSLGEVAYNAYCEKVGWMSFNGQPLPKWEEVLPRIQEAWQAAAIAVGSEITVC